MVVIVASVSRDARFSVEHRVERIVIRHGGILVRRLAVGHGVEGSRRRIEVGVCCFISRRSRSTASTPPSLRLLLGALGLRLRQVGVCCLDLIRRFGVIAPPGMPRITRMWSEPAIVASGHGASSSYPGLHLEQFGLFVLQELVYPTGVSVRDLLEIMLTPTDIVFGYSIIQQLDLVL